METVDALMATLRNTNHDGQSSVKTELLALAGGADGDRVRDYLSDVKRGELLEIQWLIDEVIDETAPAPPEPPPAPESPPEAEPELSADPNQPPTAADLDLVYDDPRGLMLHKSKTGDRWFATQVDPRTGQPQTFELHTQEVTQIQAQLKGSPYWLIGS